MICPQVLINNSYLAFMIKILSIHWGYSIGGVGKYASIIDRISDKSDVQIKSICVVSKSRQVDKLTMDALSDKIIVWRESPYDFKWYGDLKEIITIWQPDCFMSHGFNGHFIGVIVRLFINRNQKLICSYHGLYHATTPMRIIYGHVYNFLTEFYIKKMAISVVAVANHCKTYLLTKNVPDEKVEVIHNGVKDYSALSEVRTEYRRIFKISEDEVLIGIASRLDPVKGLVYLVQAFGQLVRKHDAIKMVIIGTGTQEVMLKELCKELGVEDKVVFAGFRDDIPDCLAAIDIFALPSLAEYHSIGLLEAMRAEKAIVATDVGGNTESVRHNKEGLIVKSKSSEELEQSIGELIENKELAKKLATAGRKRFLECFTEDVMIKKTAAWMLKSV